MATNGGARPGAGRPPGSVANHTLRASIMRQNLIEMYEASAPQVNAVLLGLALEGDMQAIKELHDRVYGKALQTNENINVKRYRLDDEELQKTADELTRLQKQDTGGTRTSA